MNSANLDNELNDKMPLCSLDGCLVATTGKCHLNNDPLESCPNYGRTNIEGEEEIPVKSSTDTAAPIEICSGDAMQLDDLVVLVRGRSVRTVALVGEQRAGKTTLLASIYAMYCKGEFGGYGFAGSRTLVGFAKRHHLALLNSGRTDPTTPRTSRDDPVAFFHLALARRRNDAIELIISDRSGEAYEAARLDTELIGNLPELKIADRICFLLDGAKLASNELRPAYARQFKQLIHALHDNGALAQTDHVEVLATKFDVTAAPGGTEDQVRYLDFFESQIVAEFKEHGLAITCHRVCALPKTNEQIGFHGLEDTIKRWTAIEPLPTVAPVAIHDAPRQIDRLLARTSGGVA